MSISIAIQCNIKANKRRWVGRDAVPALVQDVFGVEDQTRIAQGKTTLPLLDNDFSQRIHAVLEKARDHKAKGVGSITMPTLYVVRESGDPALKLWAQTLLVEDRADQGVSLQQWLGMLREKVRSNAEDVPLILSTWPD